MLASAMPSESRLERSSMKKAAIKREQSDACISYAKRKQARTKFNEEGCD
jgi:hypothetical protein